MHAVGCSCAKTPLWDHRPQWLGEKLHWAGRYPKELTSCAGKS